MPSGILLKEVKKLKIEDNHYTYRIETKDSQGSLIDFVDIDTVEPLRCAYDVQDELNLETNEHIKRVEEIVLNATSEEFWYVDEARTSDTHLVCYFEEVQLMANADHPMVDTDRSIFEYGKINSNEHQNTNFICTHVLSNGVSRIYMSIDKEQLTYQVFNNETIKDYIANNPITIWYALRYPVIIPRSMSKGHLLTLSGQTDISISTNGDCGLPLVKFNIGDTQYNMDINPIHLSSTTEGTQIRNIVLEGNTPINYARGNSVNTTEATSDTRYDFAPFYDGSTTISNTVEGGYVSAKLYGDTMVNIAKPYGETPLLTATNNVSLCDDLLGANEEGIVLADGEITEGRIVGDSAKTGCYNVPYKKGTINEQTGAITNHIIGCYSEKMPIPNRTFIFTTPYSYSKVIYFDSNDTVIKYDWSAAHINPVTSTPPENASYLIFGADSGNGSTEEFTYVYEDNGEMVEEFLDYRIQSVVNPTVISNGFFKYGRLLTGNGTIDNSDVTEMITELLPCPTSSFNFYSNNKWNKVAFYDENEGFIKVQETNENVGLTLNVTDIPSNAKYVRFGFYIVNGLKGLTIKYADETDVYPNLQLKQATFPHTLNKLPNGVADYIDVVNKVHVQRVGRIVLDGSETTTYTVYTINGYITRGILLDNSVSGKIYSTVGDCTYLICDKLKTINFEGFANKPYEFISIGNSSTSGYNSAIYLRLLGTTVDDFNSRFAELAPITLLYELATPIYTPLTEEEIAQLPLSAYKDGYVMLSSDQLTPSFEFRMRASNRYQVDMLETGYYYLNAPTGNIKLGTTSVDVQQMPCIIKVDNVGTGDSGYRLGLNNNIQPFSKDFSSTFGNWINLDSGELDSGGTPQDAYTDYINVSSLSKITVTSKSNASGVNKINLAQYDKDKVFISSVTSLGASLILSTDLNAKTKYIRVSYRVSQSSYESGINTIRIEQSFPQITLAKLPSHRIPTSFTQGMKCATDFGYWEGIKESAWRGIRLTGETGDGSLRSGDNNIRYLNRLEGSYQTTSIIEDEFDFATGRLTKRIGKIELNSSNRDAIYSVSQGSNGYVYITIIGDRLGAKTGMSLGNNKNYGLCITDRTRFEVNYGGASSHCFIAGSNIGLYIKPNEFGGIPTLQGFKDYFSTHPLTIYYELAVPEISYVDVLAHQGKTANNETTLYTNYYLSNTYLQSQIKPSHLTYPVPSLVGNRTYTVVHNRKNITGSTKPITLDLGGTQVELNDASGKTLVKTPSTLKHSSLIFIGGESTVDHVMILDGDWTNKPIEYFENMKGHDTDAIITILGDGKIDDVAEQYLW